MQSLIVLLRHGEIDTSSPRSFLGQTDVSLNANGIRQAEELGAILSVIPFNRIFSSPLKRAMQTAALASGQPVEAVEPINALTEIQLGCWEGLTVAEVQARFPGAYAQRGLDLEHFRPQGGESFGDLAARACPALAALATHHAGPLLIVAHAGVNRVILSHLLHRPVQTLLHIPQEYGAINILRVTPQGLRVAAINLQLEPASPAQASGAGP
jgi:probable phosphoglycerate mutase